MKTYTMMDYIQEVPKTALYNIEHYQSLVSPLSTIIEIESLQTLWLVASGSSYNACIMASYFMKEQLACDIKVVTPYTFTNYTNDIKEEDVIIVVSQSGFSTNALEALQFAKNKGFAPIALTGNKNSDIKEYANTVIEYGVGEELVGYVTKGVTTLVLFLLLFTIEKSGQTQYLNDFKKAIRLNQEVLDKTIPFINTHYKSFTSMHQCYLLGAGQSTGVCLEGALKIGELVHIPSNFYEIEEYIHGPNFQLNPNYTVLFFDNNDSTSTRVNAIYQATTSVTDHTFILTTNKAYQEDCHALVISETIESSLLPLVYLPFIQLISYIVSNDTHVKMQHPLMKRFNQLVSSKTDSYENYDEDL